MKTHAARAQEIIHDLLGSREPVPGEVTRDLKRLWQRQLRPHRGWLLVALLLTITWSAMPFGFSFTWRFAVDEIMKVGGEIDPAERSHLVFLTWAVFFPLNMAIWTVRLSFGWLRYKLVASIGQSLVYELRKELHHKLQSLHGPPVGVEGALGGPERAGEGPGSGLAGALAGAGRPVFGEALPGSRPQLLSCRCPRCSSPWSRRRCRRSRSGWGWSAGPRTGSCSSSGRRRRRCRTCRSASRSAPR